MDHFFQFDSQEDIMLWFDESLPVNQKQSAFVKYTEQSGDGFIGNKPNSKNGNINKRMIEFLRTQSRNRSMVMEMKAPERGRCHRHMINERMRREKQKQSCLALHSVLPPGTKSDQNSIIQTAVKKIQELQRSVEELERQNKELEGVLAAREFEEVEEAKIKLRVAYPSSGIDSMLEVLKCLKESGSRTTGIQSRFSAHELSAILEIETKIGAAEVEKAVQKTLYEVERKFRFHFPEGNRS